MRAELKLWRRAVLPADATIQQAIRNLDQVAIKIVLVVTENGELDGTISDGDIRRGLLRGLDLNSPIDERHPSQCVGGSAGDGARHGPAADGGQQDSADPGRR